MTKIRPDLFSGSFYPREPEKLKEQINSFLKNSKQFTLTGDLKALIVPHAGYTYSGQVAAQAYNLISKAKEKTKIIFLAPSHNYPIVNAALADYDFWKTPLGEIKADKTTLNILKNSESFKEISRAHLNEHSIEVQLPFLQTILKNFSIIPILIGQSIHQEIAEEISQIIDKKTLIIASSDLSHYHTYKKAKELDKNSIKFIENLQIEKLEKKGELCGKNSVKILLMLANKLNWKPKLLDYKNSGDLTKIKDEVVGYASFAFTD